MSWKRQVCIKNNYVIRGPFNASGQPIFSGCDQRYYYDNITIGKVMLLYTVSHFLEPIEYELYNHIIQGRLFTYYSYP